MAENKYYPRNLRDDIILWIQNEGYIAEHQNKPELTNWSIIQFLIGKLEFYGERCADNPDIFMGKKLKSCLE